MVQTLRTSGEGALAAQAVVLARPNEIALQDVNLTPPGASDVLVETSWSSISSGTERLLYEGQMPSFPGMGYPLVPGYESVGDVVWAGAESGREAGERVFVGGAACYPEGLHALFGGAAGQLVVPGDRVVPVAASLGADAVLLALAATAWHILDMSGEPELIVGHGVLGRLLARLALLQRSSEQPALTVWETDEQRQRGAQGYVALHPQNDPRRDYRHVIDVSGDSSILNALVSRLTRDGSIVLGGFYSQPLSFDFAPAFMRQARIQIAAEFSPQDLAAVSQVVDSGKLDLTGLLTHHEPAQRASHAYAQAFGDRDCLKMVLDWKTKV